MAADTHYVQMAHDKGLVREWIPIAHMAPVIIVPKQNPRHIQTITDLLRPGAAAPVARTDEIQVLVRDLLRGAYGEVRDRLGGA